jgi:single-strand DNA-binding protein
MLTMQVIGNLGADPEVKESTSGKRYARFSIASNKKIKGEKITTWVNCTVFDERKVDFLSQYVNKGTKLFIEGEPAARAYEKDGEPKASLDLVLSFGSKIEICSSEQSPDSNQSNANRSVATNMRKPEVDPFDDDIPEWD